MTVLTIFSTVSVDRKFVNLRAMVMKNDNSAEYFTTRWKLSDTVTRDRIIAWVEAKGFEVDAVKPASANDLGIEAWFKGEPKVADKVIKEDPVLKGENMLLLHELDKIAKKTTSFEPIVLHRTWADYVDTLTEQTISLYGVKRDRVKLYMDAFGKWWMTTGHQESALSVEQILKPSKAKTAIAMRQMLIEIVRLHDSTASAAKYGELCQKAHEVRMYLDFAANRTGSKEITENNRWDDKKGIVAYDMDSTRVWWFPSLESMNLFLITVASQKKPEITKGDIVEVATPGVPLSGCVGVVDRVQIMPVVSKPKERQWQAIVLSGDAYIRPDYKDLKILSKQR